MVKRCKIPPPRNGRRLPAGNPCVTPRAARTRGSPAPHSGAADDEAHRRPYRVARAEGLSAQRTRRIIAEMLAIDPPAGFFVHSQIARISEARTGARTMMREADLAAMDRIIRPTGELDPYRRVAPALDAVRVAGVGRSAGRSRGETFPACKSLKSLKMELESADGSVC